jgi:hypothetical protein
MNSEMPLLLKIDLVLPLVRRGEEWFSCQPECRRRQMTSILFQAKETNDEQ